MQPKTPTECPRCGRPLQKFNGHIGYCSQHKWVSPVGLGFEAEAAEQNRQDAAVVEKRRLDEELKKAEEEARIKREKHAAAMRKAIVVIVALCLVAAAVVFFIVRPSVNYNGATDTFMAGNYVEAKDAYVSLGDYKDSAARVILCEAMIDLQEGRPEDAAEKLDQLTSEGAGDIAKQLADALLPVMSDWKAKGLSAQALLLLLNKADVIDPNGTLDVAALKVEGHTALLDGKVHSSYADDVNSDGVPELIVLNNDYSVTVYRMTSDGNVRMAVDNETAASCAVHFGNTYKDTNVDASVACFAEAYRLLPNDETRAALASAYRLRSSHYENTGDMVAAIADARSAMETSGAADDFTFFYDVNLRNCKNGHDASTALSMWSEFSVDSATAIARFSAQDRWKNDAAQLHIARAAELAAQKDEGCIDELRQAAEMGADVTNAIAEAESYFESGLSLARLRLMEIDLLGDDSSREQQIRSEMASEVRTAITEWKSRGITPSDVPALICLADAQSIDLGGINRDSIYEDAALASVGTVAQSTFVDWDHDGNKELLTLDADGQLSLYGAAEAWGIISSIDTELASSSYVMTEERAPVILVLSNGKDESLALTGIGNEINILFHEIGINQYAVDGSPQLLPNDETRAALADAYRLCSHSHEDAGDMAAAIADAHHAMETSGADSDFTFFYDVTLRNCKNGHGAATALSMWEDFAANFAVEIARFGAQNRWKDDAAQLHIAHAIELAAQRDEACIDELRQAAEMGAEVAAAIAEAESYFDPGLSLARLRLTEIDLLGNTSGKEQQIRSEMAGEVRTAIMEWKSLGIVPSDVPVLIRLADAQGIDLGGINRDSIYEDAALASAGTVAQSTFVDWDHDGYKELLALAADGRLYLYGATETWGVVSSIDTKLPSSSYVIADENAPLILVLSNSKDEFLALTGTSIKLNTLFREAGISRYAADGETVTFSRLLEGSIARYNDYTYEAVGTTNRPVRIGIDWQQNDYPQPGNAVDAVQRYFEARAYDIPDEAILLIAESATPTIFDTAALAPLAVPDVPGTVEATAYHTEDGKEFFEVTYPSGAQSIRTWIAAEYIGGWKLIGAADTYGAGQNPSEIDYSLPLVSLNAETSNTIGVRGGRNTYRLLIPTAGRLALVWQSGDKATSRTSYTVSLNRGTLAGDAVISYDLQPNPARQQTKPMFMSAGVYYVTVEARVADAPAYLLTMTLDAQTHVELENNDTAAMATQVEWNTPYSGSLLTSNDIDFYSFTLEATSAVNVTLGTPGAGSKTTTHVYTVMNAADGARLTTVDVPGNMQLSETGNLYLSAGTYLVRVNKGSAWINDEYTLTVNVSQDGTMEAESNNTLETANAVPVNVDIHASIGQEGDIDCFSFTLDGDAVVQPRFTFMPTDSSSKTYVLTLLDSSRRELLKVNIGGKESTKVIPPVALTAGTYTVKIENPRFIRQDYTLHLASMDVAAAEKEPNDSAALATDLMVGSARTGVLSSDADIDYYKLTFAIPTTVTLKFSFPQGTSTNTVYTLTVEQNGKVQWTANVKGDSGGVEQQLQFPAGEYYVKVKPSTWVGAVYVITID